MRNLKITQRRNLLTSHCTGQQRSLNNGYHWNAIIKFASSSFLFISNVPVRPEPPWEHNNKTTMELSK